MKGCYIGCGGGELGGCDGWVFCWGYKDRSGVVVGYRGRSGGVGGMKGERRGRGGEGEDFGGVGG